MDLPLTFLENIWLADDDPDDCTFFEDVLKQVLPLTRLTIFSDGAALMDTLSHDVKPHILFLDINMPGRDGMDCLLEIRDQSYFNRLPIVIFSCTKESRFIHKSYGYGATLFYSKPTSFSELTAGLSRLFKLNWADPHSITSDQYIDNKYVAYAPSL